MNKLCRLSGKPAENCTQTDAVAKEHGKRPEITHKSSHRLTHVENHGFSTEISTTCGKLNKINDAAEAVSKVKQNWESSRNASQ